MRCGMKYVRKRLNGSMTVEAVFLLPLLMVVFLLILWLTLYLHDCLVVRSALQQAKGSEGAEVFTEEYIRDCVEGELYLCDLVQVSVTVTSTKETLVAGLFVPGFLGMSRWTQQQYIIKEEKYHVIKEQLTRITGVIVRWKDGS